LAQVLAWRCACWAGRARPGPCHALWRAWCCGYRASAGQCAALGMGKASATTAETPAAEAKSKKEKKENGGDETKTTWFGMLRRKRFIFFLGFLALCVWIMLYSSPCKVKKKVDCGYSGITAGTCRSVGGFKLDAKPDKLKVEIKREPGTKLGIKLKDAAISGINTGAVQEHNEKLSKGSAEIITLGDKLLKVDGVGGNGMTKALSNTKSELVTLEIARPFKSSLGNYLPAAWMAGKGFLAKALRSSALEQWFQSFSFLATTGFACWVLSGYPMASLPVYYMAPSAFLAWQMTRCCYNDRPDKAGDPHCYCSSGDSMRTVIEKAWAQTTWKHTEKLFKF